MTKRIPYQEWNDVTHGELVWKDADRDVKDAHARSGFNLIQMIRKISTHVLFRGKQFHQI